MDFDFASGDFAAFDLARGQFCDDLAAWVASDARQGFVRLYVEQFLLWNFEHREQPLRTLTQPDLSDYLLRWLPRQYLGDPEDAADICRSLELMIEFLAASDQLDNRFERAASLITLVAGIVDDVEEELADDANFGLNKSLLSAPLTDESGAALPDLNELLNREDLDVEELQKLLDERMTAFNELPFEERKRITDTPSTRNDLIPLGITYVPPHEAEVEASALFSEVVTLVDGFVDIVAANDIALTSAGNLKIADGRMFATELETGDQTEDITSSLDLRWVTLIDDLASAVGAVDRMTTVIRTDRSWFDLSATSKASALCDVIVEGGFLSSAPTGSDWLHQLRQLLDDGVPHWFGPGLSDGHALDVDELLKFAIEVAAVQPGSRRSKIGADEFDDLVKELVGELFTGLERFGLVVWENAEVTPGMPGGRERLTGGQLVLTPLGRHVLPRHVELAGYSFETLAGIEQASVEQLVDIAFAGSLTGPEIVERWRADEPLADRARALAAHAMDGDPVDRMVAFKVFDTVGPEVAGPVVRQLLDSTAGAHAATYLLEHGLATGEEVGSFIDLTPLVDMLTMASGDPDMFDELFREAVQNIHGDLLDDLWRHNQPETGLVLEAAGKHVTDKTLAKQARAAARRHESWLSNQGR